MYARPNTKKAGNCRYGISYQDEICGRKSTGIYYIFILRSDYEKTAFRLLFQMKDMISKGIPAIKEGYNELKNIFKYKKQECGKSA